MNTHSDLEVEDLEEQEFSVKVTDLPDEVLLKIFGYLPTYEVLRHVALVCKHFRRLSKDSSLIQEICLKPIIDDSLQEHIIEALNRSRCLHTLILKGNISLCSRNYQNMKLRPRNKFLFKFGKRIFLPLRFYVKSILA